VEKYGLFFHSVETFFPLCGPAAAGSIVWKTPIGFAGLPAPGCNPGRVSMGHFGVRGQGAWCRGPALAVLVGTARRAVRAVLSVG